MRALVDGDVWKDKNGYQRHGHDQYVHRTVAEAALGRELSWQERVHHVDYDKTNNKNSNLVVCPDESYHRLLHARQRILDLGGRPDTHSYCSYHKCLHPIREFSTTTHTWNGFHNMCRVATNQYRKENGLNRNKFNWKARLDQQYRRVFSNYTKRAICKL